MVGTGLKKLAEELGLKTDQGVAYGEYLGFNVTFSEGMGYKLLGISTKSPDAEQVDAFLASLPDDDSLLKNFRINALNIHEDAVVVNFHDNPGTMNKFRDALNWILPQLKSYGFTGSGYCPLCGSSISPSDPWKLDEVVAHHVHPGCSSAAEMQSANLVEQFISEDTGSYGRGFLGALAGAILGAIPWAVALFFGFFVSMLGFVIGFLAQKGYDLAGGRYGKGEIAIVIITSVFGVILGNVLSDVLILGTMINDGEIAEATLRDIPLMLTAAYTDIEFLKGSFLDLGMGLFFAFLGMIGMIRDLRNSDPTSKRRMKDLQQA